MKSYVQRSVYSARATIDRCAANSVHGQRILTMVLADDKWVMRFIGMTSQFAEFFESDLLRPIGKAVLELMYVNPDKFTKTIYDDADLKQVIAAVPKDQEYKLCLHYQLYVKQPPLSEIIDKHCPNAETLDELNTYLARNLATLQATTLLQLREHIAGKTKSSELSAEIRTALVKLQTILVLPVKTDAIYKDKMKFISANSQPLEVEHQKPHAHQKIRTTVSPPRDF